MDFETLRNTYKNFYYHSFRIEENDEYIRVIFDFEIEGLSEFHPTFTIPQNNSHRTNSKLFRKTAFSLGLVELISYWKISCPKNVIIECGHLDDYQVSWWKKLYYYGLGEFFYQNGIKVTMDEFMSVHSSDNDIDGEDIELDVKGNLIPVGGGKDSFVSLDLLKDECDNCVFIINPIISAVNSAHAAGYEEGKNLIICKRTLDSNMLELNKQGYLNGHTPFSAMAAFASYLTSIVYGKKYITLSNEASANESTIKDTKVNHQYSKTYEFECDFNDYCKRYLNEDIKYFSLLRCLSELQIANIFSRLDKYLLVFRSCNVGQKKGEWCGHCAKCLFVNMMMSAFLNQSKIIEIFGRDMLNDLELKTLFEQLTGILDDKPFECVGTRDEVNMAICMAIKQMRDNNESLPKLYEYYMTTKYYSYYIDKQFDIMEFNDENNIPLHYQEIVKKRLKAIYDEQMDR